MGTNILNLFSGADGNLAVAPLGTPDPVLAGSSISPLSAPWVDLGGVSDAGAVQGTTETSTPIYQWNGQLIRMLITKEQSTFDLSLLETKLSVLQVFFKGSTSRIISSATAANEVQTATITGTPTGGTFTLTFAGQITSAIAYNATPAAVQAALQALSNIGAGNVTVTGTAGSSYVMTFAGALADTDVALITATASFTGGSTPAIAVVTTTPGAPGPITQIAYGTPMSDKRAWVLDLKDGPNLVRKFLPSAEVSARKTISYTSATVGEYGITVTAYPDTSGNAVYEYHENLS